jgi:hypothetical protein
MTSVFELTIFYKDGDPEKLKNVVAYQFVDSMWLWVKFDDKNMEEEKGATNEFRYISAGKIDEIIGSDQRFFQSSLDKAGYKTQRKGVEKRI